MASLINKVLYPMDLKRYMVLSFATLWSLALLIALVTTIVHQINFQDSSTEVQLKWTVKALKEDLADANRLIIGQKEEIHLLKCVRPEVSIDYYSCE